jgi:hypothetical protein
MTPQLETELRTLREICKRAASHETAYNGDYEPELWGALDNHCGVVSILVNMLYGGTYRHSVIDGERHIWNRLPDGSEVDLTSCQFKGDGFHPLPVESTDYTIGPVASSKRLYLFLLRVGQCGGEWYAIGKKW